MNPEQMKQFEVEQKWEQQRTITNGMFLIVFPIVAFIAGVCCLLLSKC
jgi:hypothetical protein